MSDIAIYPSSWYYNACVQGFLEVLAWGMGEEGGRLVEEHMLQEDGRAVIPGGLAEAVFGDGSAPMPAGFTERLVPAYTAAPGNTKAKRIVRWWVGKSFDEKFIRREDRKRSGELTDPLEITDSVCYNLFNQKSYYPNLMQLKWDVGKKIDFLNFWFALDKDGEGGSIGCSFCGRRYKPDAGARIYDAFFTLTLSKDLGSGPSVFPNAFWDDKPNLTVCRTCRSYFLCYHLVHRRKFFVNSDSLLVNWHLNGLLAGKVRPGGSAYQGVLLDSLLYDSQLRRGVGGWGLQNIEVLVFDRNEINYYPISAKLAKMFLLPQISVLVSRAADHEVWDAILKEKFSYLSVIIYNSLRTCLSGGSTASAGASRDIQTAVDLIDLYYEIIKYLAAEEGDKFMGHIKLRELRELAKQAPLAQDDNLVFRLLELTRLNRKADVYHLLLRLYVAENLPFPEELAQVFSVGDSELFKTGVYAYISGLRPGGKGAAQQVEGQIERIN